MLIATEDDNLVIKTLLNNETMMFAANSVSH